MEDGIVSLKSSYAKVIKQGYEVIYLDEFVITSKTYQDRTWMFKNRPFEIDYRMNQVGSDFFRDSRLFTEAD